MKVTKNFFLIITAILLHVQLSLYCAKVYYSEPMNYKDTFCLVWATKRVYDGDLTGETQEQKNSYSREKTYLNTAFINKDGSLAKLFSFPTSLMVTPEDVENNAVKTVFFLPRTTASSYRKFITVEGNNLFLYEVGIEIKTINNKPTLFLSEDFAKRLQIASNIDTSYTDIDYVVWADKDENIYYKIIDPKDNTKLILYKWNARTANPEIVQTEVNANIDAALQGEAFDNNGEISVKLGENIFKITDPCKIIDPLGANEDILLCAYLDYGTSVMPFTKSDFKKLTETYDLELGKVIALNKLITANKQIVSNLTEEQLVNAKKSIQKIVVNYNTKKDLLREAKKLMRENPINQDVEKKWLTNTEVNAILTALDPEQGVGGGVIEKFNHNGRTEVSGGKIVLPLGYYRDLKIKCKRNFDKKLWENYTKENEANLKQAIQSFSKKVVSGNQLADAINKFMNVKDQKDWKQWFIENKDVKIELLFDYLASQNKDSLNKIFSEHIQSQAQAKTLLKAVSSDKDSDLIKKLRKIVSTYKHSDLYNGMEEKK